MVWCGVIVFDVVRVFRLASLALPVPVSFSVYVGDLWCGVVWCGEVSGVWCVVWRVVCGVRCHDHPSSLHTSRTDRKISGTESLCHHVKKKPMDPYKLCIERSSTHFERAALQWAGGDARSVKNLQILLHATGPCRIVLGKSTQLPKLSIGYQRTWEERSSQPIARR